MTDLTQEPNKAAAWLMAMRPRTLPLAVATILLGSLLAAADQAFRWPVFILAMLTAVFLQILSNLANDYGDFVHGADHGARQGPVRVVHTGLISARAMRGAITLFVLLSAISGLALLWLALDPRALGFLLAFALLGAAAIGAAITYTVGKKPYGYAGLGDLAVLVFFGWAGVLGTYFLHGQQLDWPLILPATSCGLLAVAVLNVNNIRDMESDRKAGKYSLPVRLGLARARLYHWGLLSVALVTAVLYVLLTYTSPWQFLFLLTIPLFWRNGTAVSGAHAPEELNPVLKQTAMMTLIFVLTLGAGQLIPAVI